MVLSCRALSSKTWTLHLLWVTLPTTHHIWWRKVSVKVQLEFILLQLVSIACSTVLTLVFLLHMYKQASLSPLQTTISLSKKTMRSPLRSLFSSSYGWTSPVSQTLLKLVWASAPVLPCLLLVSFQFDNVCLLLEIPKLDMVLHMWSNECQIEKKEGKIIEVAGSSLASAAWYLVIDLGLEGSQLNHNGHMCQRRQRDGPGD